MGTVVFAFCLSVLGDAESGICCGLAGKELLVHNLTLVMSPGCHVCVGGVHMEMIENVLCQVLVKEQNM